MNNIHLTEEQACRILDYIRMIHIANGYDLKDSELIEKLMKIMDET
jgi:hypothetical protein